MNKQTPFIAVMAGLILGISLPLTSTAGMVDGKHWLVKSGDSVYSIARNVFPGNSKQQARLRRELVKSNPNVFKGNPNALSVGAKLKLPAFASNKQASRKLAQKPKAIRLPQPRPKNKAAPVRVAHKAVTADPADRVGKVIINMGDLRAVNRGSERKLARNSSVLKGDTLKTANNTHTQIRLRDGALISLRPNTEFRIADFRYNGNEDGTERGLFELIKGGFRTITGAIGHRNKQNYRVNTTVATIGIRGTHYGLVLCTDGSCTSDGTNLADGLYGGVVDGAVVANNTTGEFSFTNDEYFHIASQTATPEPILEPTLVFDDTSPSAIEVAATDSSSSESVATSGTVTSLSSAEIANVPVVDLVDPATASVVAQPLSNQAPSGSGMVLAFNYNDSVLPVMNGVAAPVSVINGTTDAIYLETLQSGVTIPVAAFEDDQGTTHSISMGSAVPSDLGSATFGESTVNWGRWSGDFTVTENGVPLEPIANQNLHFIYSNNVLDITDPTTIANLSGLGTTVSYGVVGGTHATDHNGNVDPSLAAVTMNVDFSLAQISSYDVTMFGGEYQGSATGIGFTSLNDSFTISGGPTTTCGAGCSGQASVIFVGSQAEGALTSYSLTSTDGQSSASGSSALQR